MRRSASWHDIYRPNQRKSGAASGLCETDQSLEETLEERPLETERALKRSFPMLSHLLAENEEKQREQPSEKQVALFKDLARSYPQREREVGVEHTRVLPVHQVDHLSVTSRDGRQFTGKGDLTPSIT